MSGQGSKCRLLISPHEAAVAIDVGAEDSGELAFHTHLSLHHPVGCNDCQTSVEAEAREPTIRFAMPRQKLLLVQLIEQRLGVFQIGSVEAFGEPVYMS